MPDYIERDALYEKTANWERLAFQRVEQSVRDGDLTEWRKWSAVLAERSAFKFDVADAPAADVQPVVHGRWVGFPECLKYPNAYADDHIVRSACEECFSVLDDSVERFNYCPHCGAKMDLKENK